MAGTPKIAGLDAAPGELAEPVAEPAAELAAEFAAKSADAAAVDAPVADVGLVGKVGAGGDAPQAITSPLLAQAAARTMKAARCEACR